MSYFFAKEYSPYILNERSINPIQIDFYPETHSYFVNTKIQYPSVSYILQSVFGNKFTHVNPEVLRKACEKGTEVHSEILNYVVSGEFGFTPEFSAAAKEINAMMDQEPDKLASEQILYCDNLFHNFCCTIDNLWLKRGLLVDYKTSSKLDKASVTRQLNIYRYALEMNGWKVNALEAWHLSGDVLKKFAISIKDNSYVESILESYAEGLQFKNDREMLEHFNIGEDYANKKHSGWEEIYY